MKNRYLVFRNIFTIVIIVVLAITMTISMSIEAKVVLKNFVNQELTLDEIRSSKLYDKYRKIKLNGTYEDVENIFGKAGVEGSWGLLQIWKYSYGSVEVGLLNNRIIHKHIVFYNSPRYQISEEDTKGIKGITTFDEVESRIGKSLEYGKSISIKDNKISTTYIWKNVNNEVLKIDFSEGTVYDIDWINRLSY